MQLRQPSPDPFVSFSDFLLERFGLVASMQVAVVASFANTGQLCISIERIYVSEPIAERFTEALGARVRALRLRPQREQRGVGAQRGLQTGSSSTSPSGGEQRSDVGEGGD